MSKKITLIIFVLSVFFTFNTFAQNANHQKSDQSIVENDFQLSRNDLFVMHTLRTIHSAQMTYHSSYTLDTDFGSVNDLIYVGLIDSTLASGEKYGYRFKISTSYQTVTSPGSYEVRATPMIRGARSLSFYMNESCDIRGAMKRGRDATINDTIVEPCGLSKRSSNEQLAITSLRSIYTAQVAYYETYGAGNYGSADRLLETNLNTSGFVIAGFSAGYDFTMTIIARSPTEPSRFIIKIVPQQYNRSGVRSFYLDQTGVLRGADKRGEPADETDSPINY